MICDYFNQHLVQRGNVLMNFPAIHVKSGHLQSAYLNLSVTLIYQDAVRVSIDVSNGFHLAKLFSFINSI